jgi:hypothetical protein
MGMHTLFNLKRSEVIKELTNFTNNRSYTTVQKKLEHTTLRVLLPSSSSSPKRIPTERKKTLMKTFKKHRILFCNICNSPMVHRDNENHYKENIKMCEILSKCSHTSWFDFLVQRKMHVTTVRTHKTQL